MNWIHSFFDRSSVPTWRYERTVRVLLETLLLVICAAPVITGWRSLVAQVLVGALRLHQAENGREKASILGRYAEQNDGEPYSVLAAHKQTRIKTLDARDALITWTWPALVPIVSAAETRSFTLVLVLGILATLARVAFDKLAIPRWRLSRLEWKGKRS